ncbi:MAG: ATP-binding protein [Gammaproteobacteria bacterium]|uniref:AAA family ATPase n=1 Tax=Vibrio parahaemolyticus TaxID=670 RepID=UPI0017F4B7BB|nr:ATP-binding protein [Vibrio parahaemolyticus]NVJ67515.1 ATP-binding protein [Gammaproteobacteria bacterium]EGR3374368.1 ATP-binding protein [Vibrio parahaemolyticus]EHZ2491365.1 ATP-binding protein [Vibrio parahaemolyticus]EJG0983648.1 ATP-binding protein [Vibrio parahaemolyticus]MCX8946502.1 ATP-binding protein [Vibrio parahaemolyticus]
MARYIQRIDSVVPYTQQKVEIDLQGRNLILTGGNGCGKTSLLNELSDVLIQRIIERENYNIDYIKGRIKKEKEYLSEKSVTDSLYAYQVKEISRWEKKLEFASKKCLEISSMEKFVTRFHEKKAVLSFYKAIRDADIEASISSVSKNVLKKRESELKEQTTSSTMFEQYLVSNKTSQAYAESPSIDNDLPKANAIQEWFNKLEEDFQKLFEDKTLSLVFDSEEQAFLINQLGKQPFRFQNLSSGFSSILSVYADLLMKVELREVPPSELDGVVFIDEIDAHLHVSLQKKILAFLVEAFPQVQFIVTTHSPFVVSSVNNAVIYDMSRCEQIQDLSMYSYDAILEGLFDITPISEILKNKIISLHKIAQSQSPDINDLSELVNEVSPYESKLDEESAFYLQNARLVINKARR